MKAIIHERYGAPEEVLRVAEVDEPRPGPGEVVVAVRASAVAGDDWHLMRGEPYVARIATGLRRPRSRIPGRELAGRVETVGEGVTRLTVGDEVFGWSAGAFAERAAVAADSLVAIPEGISYAQAAVTPISGFTALQALRDVGRVGPGDTVLVIGASGGVGTFAVQIARVLGARVTGVAGSAGVSLVAELGADRVIDYGTEDPLTGDERYDTIVDLVGNRPLRALRRALTPDGTLVLVGGTGGRWLKGTQRFLVGLVLSPFVRARMRPLVHADRRADLEALAEMISAGVLRPVVSAGYPLDEAGRAVGHFAAGHARGKVAIMIGSGSAA